jgi:hypothetical protein
VIRYERKAGERSLDLLRWGLVPYWAKDLNVGFANINAKAEGIETRPAFRDAFQRRRCLVPVDSFYEWKKTATGKQPYAIGLAGGSLMALAGLWENWRSPAGEWLRSFAIITTTPNELCGELQVGPSVAFERQRRIAAGGWQRSVSFHVEVVAGRNQNWNRADPRYRRRVPRAKRGSDRGCR